MTALNERLYVKLVRVVVQTQCGAATPDDSDKTALKYGLDRLSVKRSACKEYSETKGVPRINPIMLVCCEDQAHAKLIAEWLQVHLNSAESVLLVHSRLGEDSFLTQLRNVESNESPVRVIVNVMMLSEGWDVSNVYVIVPLRKMASVTLLTQVMGRGLRLPYGAQTNETEVDTLDILNFGNETLTAVSDSLINQGFGVNRGQGMSLEQDQQGLGSKKVVRETKDYELEVANKISEIHLPSLKLELPPLDVAAINIPKLSLQEISSLFVHDPQTVITFGGQKGIPRDAFRKSVSSHVIRKCSFLSATIHKNQVLRTIDKLLIDCEISGEEIPLSTDLVSAHISAKLIEVQRLLKPTYSFKTMVKVDLAARKIRIRSDCSETPASQVNTIEQWKSNCLERVPLSGWRRCVYKAVPFDQFNELHVAKIIDRSSDVQWWLRNLPGIITLDTPAGRYSPDFAVLLNANDTNVLLEVKGEVFAQASDGDANLKKDAANFWCKAASNAMEKPWQHWFILSKDTLNCHNITDIRNKCEIV